MVYLKTWPHTIFLDQECVQAVPSFCIKQLLLRHFNTPWSLLWIVIGTFFFCVNKSHIIITLQLVITIVSCLPTFSRQGYTSNCKNIRTKQTYKRVRSRINTNQESKQMLGPETVTNSYMPRTIWTKYRIRTKDPLESYRNTRPADCKKLCSEKEFNNRTC